MSRLASWHFFPCFLEDTHPQILKFINFLGILVRDGRRVPESRDNGNLHHPVNLLRGVHVLGQLLDVVKRDYVRKSS